MINEEARSGLTTSTRHNTTPLYAAPEILLANGDAPPFEPTTASDVYSLGSLLYEVSVLAIFHKVAYMAHSFLLDKCRMQIYLTICISSLLWSKERNQRRVR